ncbi:Hypothetical predicted protein [Cloeon dipterum]|uniref:Uncharacterized protein n=1 Tax=Cloeon dipterum TaxID=197152 RepID=A0A8S1DVN1_9INSE|nr:Hypothetical predicted protein [Cloeon dipterum]
MPPTWLEYHTQYLPSNKEYAVTIDCGTDGDVAVYMARTFYKSYYVPGFALNGVGYFVTKERQLFQASIFQVFAEADFKFDYFSQSGDSMVADDVVDETDQIKFGTFEIGGVRYCGMVDSQHTCHINFFAAPCYFNVKLGLVIIETG